MHHITKGILTGNVQTCVLILSVTLLEAINPNIHIWKPKVCLPKPLFSAMLLLLLCTFYHIIHSRDAAQPTRQRYRKSVMNCICSTIPIMMMMMVIILFSMIIHSCWQQLLKNWKWTESKQQTYYKNILFFSFFRFSYISFRSLSFLSFVARSELKKQFVCKKSRFGTQVPRGVCIE